MVHGLTEDDLVLCLISGGGSSLLCLPSAGVTLADKQAVGQALLRSGATISEVNCVRKHLSAIKGGRLGVACYPARLVTYAISDVPGDDAGVIASGPTVPDPTTFGDALVVLAEYGIGVPASVRSHLRAGAATGSRCPSETPKPGTTRLPKSEFVMLARSADALTAAAGIARSAGVNPLVLADDIEGEASVVAEAHGALAHLLAETGTGWSSPCVLLSAGETTVTVRGPGRGGRNGEYLLALAAALGGAPGIYALAADTDGIDGSEDNAGAWITPDTLDRAAAVGMDPKRMLSENDSYSFFARLGDLLVTGCGP
jgi:hydroxypyruvate reductase